MHEIQSNQLDITCFVPCYNEENNIVKTLNTIISAVNKTKLSYEIVVVDDKSEDLTKEIVKKFIEQNKSQNIILRENQVNLGLGRGYIDTAFFSRGEHYMLVNGDNAEGEGTLLKLLNEVGKADMIIPYFSSYDNRRFHRVTISKAFTLIINIISGYKIKYYNGPVIHKRYNVMRWSPDTHGFAYQAEIIVKVLDEKGTFHEVMIDNLDREDGSSKAFKIRNILAVSHSILQIFLRRLRSLFFY
jgi:glycosyltransferase involved in cell wall biosynthesis